MVQKQLSKESIEKIFDSYFTKVEGSLHSHDKSSYVTERVLKSLETKEKYPLQKSCDIEYWCPKTLRDTDEAIDVIDSIVHLKFEEVLKNFNKEGLK